MFTAFPTDTPRIPACTQFQPLVENILRPQNRTCRVLNCDSIGGKHFMLQYAKKNHEASAATAALSLRILLLIW